MNREYIELRLEILNSSLSLVSNNTPAAITRRMSILEEILKLRKQLEELEQLEPLN